MLPDIAARIAAVEFHCCPAVQLIRSHDGPDTLHYCDPPYLHATRTAKAAYGPHEMTDADHAALLDCLLACRGKVMLSGYRNPLYDAALDGWRREEFDLPNNAGQNKVKARRVECVWCNF
jgi:DNA adenine methylase